MPIRITKSRAAMAALFVLAGVGLGSLLSPLVGSALATVGQTVNISDNSAAAYFAKVSSDGKLAVGDGAGPLTVDGTVRPAAPAIPWRTTRDIQSPGQVIAGPSPLPLNVTSLSISTDAGNGNNIDVYVTASAEPGTATSCDGPHISNTIWHILDAGDGVTPPSVSGRTPLQYSAPEGMKACLQAFARTTARTTMNAVGFYGG